MQQILLQSLSISEFKELLNEVIEEKLKLFQPPEKHSDKSIFLTRLEVAKLLKISLPTLNDWSKRGVVQSYRIGSRILYKQDEIEQSLKHVHNLKYRRGY